MEEIKEYSDTTKHTCLCFGIITVLTLLFIISPIQNYSVISFFGKLLILCIIVYLVKYNLEKNVGFYNKYKEIANNNATVQMNLVTNFVFAILLVILCVVILMSIIR